MTTTETMLAPYEPLRAQIAELKEANANTVFKYEEPKGNKLARSHVASLRTVKGDIERKRKELKADALEYGRKVDAVAKELSGEIEAMIEVHQGPLDLIESREEARKTRHLNNVASLTLIPGIDEPATSEACRKKLAYIKSFVVDDKWEEFKAQALEAQAVSVRRLEGSLTKLLKSESEAAELAKHREEQAKADAAEAARITAEVQARREAALVLAAEIKAKREAADAAMADARKKEAEAQAAINTEKERTRKAELQVAKARQEKAEAEAKAEREAREKREADAKRAANKKHREKVIASAVEALSEAMGVEYEIAEAAIDAIADGKIPHVRIEF